MALSRGVVAVVALIPAALLGVEGHARAEAPGAVQVLPYGIHQDGNGRYHRDIGDHGQARHPFSSILLPQTFSPFSKFPLPLAGTSCPTPPLTANGGPFGMTPADILAAYKVPANAKANGAIVAILDSPDKNALKDVQAYRTQYNIPQLQECASGHGGVGQTPCFSQVAEDGSPSTGGDNANDDGETSLDMDMISAMCSDCSILLVELTQLADADFVTATATAAQLGASATSISIGGSEQTNDPTGNNYTTAGNLVFAASGDFGYDLVDQGAKGRAIPRQRRTSSPSAAPTSFSRRDRPGLAPMTKPSGTTERSRRRVQARTRHDERVQQAVQDALAGDADRQRLQRLPRDGRHLGRRDLHGRRLRDRDRDVLHGLRRAERRQRDDEREPVAPGRRDERFVADDGGALRAPRPRGSRFEGVRGHRDALLDVLDGGVQRPWLDRLSRRHHGKDDRREDGGHLHARHPVQPRDWMGRTERHRHAERNRDVRARRGHDEQQRQLVGEQQRQLVGEQQRQLVGEQQR